ncbi:histidine kinase [uncultured Aquimarina sp.]|uniref:sensor histidine kinase n=1 Tax=uncultured Aquimarina sp. TaxID=575652 RepID=UPI002622AA27|nr:histidine kinase [uncultured Aquimarina sp.]
MSIRKDFFLNKKLLRFLLLFYFMAYVIDFTGSILVNYWRPTPVDQDIGKTIVTFIVYYIYKSLFLGVAIYITLPFIYKRKYFIQSLILHTFAAFLLSFYSSFMAMVSSKLIHQTASPITIESVWVRGLSGLSFNFFVYFTMLAIVYAYYYLKKQTDTELREQNLKSQLLDSKINALQSQLQPHFLFNTLNDISALMEINVEKSQNAIADLSDLLRDTLNLKDVKLLTLKQELYLLKKYIQIEKIRFGDKIDFKININDELLELQVPPLVLQPIIENSIKHGFSLKHDNLKITLKASKAKNYLVIEVSNNGKPIPKYEDVTFGTGITNILSRIDTIYEGNYHFSMDNLEGLQDNSGVLTTIKLPIVISNIT